MVSGNASKVILSSNIYILLNISKIMVTEIYRGWQIVLFKAKSLCAVYGFDIIDPQVKMHHVAKGGEKRERALERAREMIDMELAYQRERE
jgi:hypothetical protein